MNNQDKSFYVYALKNPRTTPSKPFYVGKGTSLRIFEHVQKIDDSAKGRVISEIITNSQSVLETKLLDNLTESKALRIEAELISAFGTIDSGDMLTNSVMPKGLGAKKRPLIIVPQGAQERAQLGLTLLKSAVPKFVKANANGVSNAAAASILGLRSDYAADQETIFPIAFLAC